MKLATLKNGMPDGSLVVVSRDLATGVPASAIAPTLQAAIERWDEAEPALRELAAKVEAGEAAGAFEFDPAAAESPLPRAYQWIDGSAFMNHGQLMAQALHPDRENEYDLPLVYQGASDDFIGPRDDIVVADESDGIDFEGEVAVIVDDVPMRTPAAEAEQHVKLLLLVNDVSLRGYVPRELSAGFGFFNAKPSSAFSPVAVTPDELGDAWREGRFHHPLHVEWNGEWFGHPNAREMTFTFHELIEHVTRTRRLRAGTIIGSGTVSNEDRSMGSACIAERRAIEVIEDGAPSTRFMTFGDRVRIEMVDDEGRSIFGSIEQTIVPYERNGR